jgi:hypothetical protein
MQQDEMKMNEWMNELYDWEGGKRKAKEVTMESSSLA